MKIRLGNTASKVIVGGADNLKGNIRNELKQYLSATDTSGYWARKHGKGFHGSGKRFFITPKGQIGTGFVPMVITWAEEEFDLDVELYDERPNMPEFLPKDQRQYRFGKYDMATFPYDYQGKMLDKLIDHTLFDGRVSFPRGILDAATNAGKSIVSYALWKNMVGNDQKCLFLIHSSKVYKQMVDFLTEEMGETDIGRIDGRVKRFGSFTVAMQKTLGNWAQNDPAVARILKNEIQMLIVDECHRAGAKDYSALIRRIDAGAKVFVSGTPLKMSNKLNKLKVVGLSGNVLYKVSKKELQDREVSERIKARVLYHKPILRRERVINGKLLATPAIAYDDHVAIGIHESRSRVQVLLDELTKPEYNDKFIMVAFWAIEHGELMKEMFEEVFGKSQVTISHGSLSNAEQDENQRQFVQKEKRIMLAGAGYKEGLNIKHIQVLAYCLGGISAIDMSQFTGRLERKFDGQGGILLDFYDDCKYLDEHSRKRMREYKKEQFVIETNFETDKYFRPKIDSDGKTITKEL